MSSTEPPNLILFEKPQEYLRPSTCATILNWIRWHDWGSEAYFDWDTAQFRNLREVGPAPHYEVTYHHFPATKEGYQQIRAWAGY